MLVVSGVFALAGTAKLLDRKGSRNAATSFGVPDALAGFVGLGLPVAEIAIAVLLLPTATRWHAAMAALVLLVAFCAAIARVMARGESPDCHCFGQLHSGPVGWRTLARNGVLLALALVMVVAGRDEPGPSAVAWTGRLDAVAWALAALALTVVAAVTFAGVAIVHVLRSYGRVLVR